MKWTVVAGGTIGIPTLPLRSFSLFIRPVVRHCSLLLFDDPLHLIKNKHLFTFFIGCFRSNFAVTDRSIHIYFVELTMAEGGARCLLILTAARAEPLGITTSDQSHLEGAAKADCWL